MRVSYHWLKDYVDFSLSPPELAEVLTMAGLEVEDLEPVGPALEGVQVAQIVAIRPHPNAEKLRLCEVNLGEKTLEVVCGAPNVAVGQKIPFIGIGSKLPDGTAIEARTIRGIRSEGMICSARELQLSEEAQGILVLDSSAPVGSTLRHILGPQDWSLNLEITINRPDCLSHWGVAREIAAALRVPLRLPSFSAPENGPPIDSLTHVEIVEPQLCPRYSARIVRGVKIAASPEWLQQRLEAVGLRAINNVVDVTNFVMLEIGHPLHAFDFHRLEGGRIRVRCAAAGERFVTLDGQEHTLDSQMLLICDTARGVALAGIMGGENSEILEDTTDLLLESAYFNPVNIRRTSKLLGLASDSSYRFERGADPNATIVALDRTAQLIAELADGEVATGVADVYPAPMAPRRVELRSARVPVILGADVPPAETKEHLERLGCRVEGQDVFVVQAPTYRRDLEREIDLIEEIARLHSYNLIPTAQTATISLEVPYSETTLFRERLRDVLVKSGFCQVLTSSLLSKREVSLPGYPPPVKLKSPGSEDLAYLASALLPRLLKVAAHNVHRETENLRIFEIGRVFSVEQGQYREWDEIAGLMVGSMEPYRWDVKPQALDFLDLKGVVEGFLAEILLDKAEFFHYDIERYTADSLSVRYGEQDLGAFGRIHTSITEVFEIEEPVFAFEFSTAQLEAYAPEKAAYKPFSKYPSWQRDLAFTVAEDIQVGLVLEGIRNSAGRDLLEVKLFDIYQGPQIGSGQKSLAFRLIFQSLEKTLTDAEVEPAVQSVIEAMERDFKAKLRA
ncbi:MAG: phenylalanine--tRNA ligase subunit beta [bacterium]